MPAVLFEDADVVAVSKPAGVAVIPRRDGDKGACLHGALEAARGERLWVVHRIDQDTSGVVVFARNAEAHRELSVAFERREVKKTYVAYAHGEVVAAAGGARARTIDVALVAARKGKTRPAEPGDAKSGEAKPSETRVRVVRRWKKGDEVVAKVEAEPLTGRHHQIRVHLRYVGAPLVWDRLYGKHTGEGALSDAPCKRLALHAWRLEVPERGLKIEAPLAEDLQAMEAWLDQTWTAEAAA